MSAPGALAGVRVLVADDHVAIRDVVSQTLGALGAQVDGAPEGGAAMAMLYSAADIFVGPSLEEAFGQVFIEAAACGTPSVGYPVGGKPEAILNGVSGLLAESVAPDSLADAIETLYMDRALREDMGRWARLWAESRWSMAASAHRLFAVMRMQGLVERLGLLPRLSLTFEPAAPPEPVAVVPTLPGWRPLAGFDHWEGPYPDRGIGRCRSAHGPVARFEISAAVAGRATLLISCRCYQQGQHVRLLHEGRPVGERDIPEDKQSRTDHVMAFDVVLKPGPNIFEMQSSKWTPGSRPMAVLVTSIATVSGDRAPSGPALNGRAVVEAKPLMPAAVR